MVICDFATAQATTERVSVSCDEQQANGASTLNYGRAISDDGRWAVFSGDANNLVGADNNDVTDVFVRDRCNECTTRISLGPNNEESDGACTSPSISASGRYVAFRAYASNWNLGGSSGGNAYVRDRDLDGNGVFDEAAPGCTTTLLVSVTSEGLPVRGWDPAISGNGRHVVFTSNDTHLDPFRDDTNQQSDVFVHDRDPDGDGTFDQPGEIRTVRISIGAWTGNDYAQGNNYSNNATISDDGRHVAFASTASNFDPYRSDNNGTGDVFVHDRDADGDGEFDEQDQSDGVSTVRVNISSAYDPDDEGGHQEANHYSSLGIVSGGTGRYIAFYSHASNLTNDDTPPVCGDNIYVHDRDADADGLFDEQTVDGGTRTVLVSKDSAGIPDCNSVNPYISPNGRFVVFYSTAAFVLPKDNAYLQVFVRDRDADSDGVFDEDGEVATLRVSINSDCQQANERADGYPCITPDGRQVLFASWASNLCSGDTNNLADVFVRDRGIWMEPTVTAHPDSQSMNAGDDVEFCVVAGGERPLDYWWRKDGVPLDESDEHFSGVRTSFLTIHEITFDDAGDYDCVVTHGWTCVEVWSRTATLTVNCPGDLDGDSDIDQTDLGILLAYWGQGDGGDLDGDGDTDQSDLGILLAHWGEGCE